MSLRERLRGVRCNKPLEVRHPRLGDEPVYVRTLTGAQSDKFKVFARKYTNPTDDQVIGMQARMVAFGLCDENGVAPFDPDNADDVAEINEMPADLLDVIGTAFLTNNGLTKDAQEAAKKNSDATLQNGSGSSSQEASDAPSPN